jgi:hypothetical protein
MLSENFRRLARVISLARSSQLDAVAKVVWRGQPDSRGGLSGLPGMVSPYSENTIQENLAQTICKAGTYNLFGFDTGRRSESAGPICNPHDS